MIKGGFSGRILHIELEDRRISRQPMDSSLAHDYVGGLGICVKLACERIKGPLMPLSSENPIVIGAGPLVGTGLPGTSRLYCVTKLPQSRTVGWCGAGGMSFGCNLKNAGYDHVVIEGKADHPVYIKIADDEVEICDAGALWGKGVEETSEILWKLHGRTAGIMAIGPAAENLVSFSMAFVDRVATLGRGGFGAVMGSKNLKAIVAKGKRGVSVADKKRYGVLSDRLLERIRGYRYLKEWQELGLIKSVPIVPLEVYRKIKKRRMACVSCPIGDKDIIEVPDGEFQGMVKCASSVVNLFFPLRYGFKDYREAIRCVAILDDYGMDLFEFFGLMVFARRLQEEGVLGGSAAEEEIRPDSLGSMETWARKVAFRQGLGDTLADGMDGIMRDLGDKARRYAPATVKGMFPYISPSGPVVWDLFGTMELGQLLEPRGPHVGSSGSPTYLAKRPLDQFPRHLLRMGVPEDAIHRILPSPGPGGKQQDLKVGRLLRYAQDWFSLLACVGICARAQINRFYDASLCAELYRAVTGIQRDPSGLIKYAARLWDLLREANLRQGVERKEQLPPEQWLREPPFKDYVTGSPLAQEEITEMIRDYYEERGWTEPYLGS